MIISTWTVIIGLFFYFLFKWLFRVLAMATVAKIIGQAKQQLLGKKGDAA